MKRRKMRVQISRRQKMAIGLFFLVCAALWWSYHRVSQPVQGRSIAASGTTLPVKKLQQPPVANNTATTVSSPYFELSLPAGYQAQASSTETPGLLYQQTILKPSTFGSLIIAVAVKALPEGGLSNDSSYSSRIQQPARYRFTDQNVQGDTVRIASDSQTASTVVFWPHGSYLATIGVSAGISNPGNDNSDQIAALQPLLAAWRWR